MSKHNNKTSSSKTFEEVMSEIRAELMRLDKEPIFIPYYKEEGGLRRVISKPEQE